MQPQIALTSQHNQTTIFPMQTTDPSTIPDFFSPRELATRWGLGLSTVTRWLLAGRLPCVKFGYKCIRVSRESVLAFEKKHAIKAKGKNPSRGSQRTTPPIAQPLAAAA